MPYRALQEEERSLWTLFGTFFKIGLFTFGGGYAMIALLENEFITQKHWLGRDEFLNMAAIAESTPGPVAINSATYLGYKLAGVPGAAVATVAVSLPSFGIIYAISLFFDQFTSLTVVAHAFQGIQVFQRERPWQRKETVLQYHTEKEGRAHAVPRAAGRRAKPLDALWHVF